MIDKRKKVLRGSSGLGGGGGRGARKAPERASTVGTGRTAEAGPEAFQPGLVRT